jgi:hypothetical protein
MICLTTKDGIAASSNSIVWTVVPAAYGVVSASAVSCFGPWILSLVFKLLDVSNVLGI